MSKRQSLSFIMGTMFMISLLVSACSSTPKKSKGDDGFNNVADYESVLEDKNHKDSPWKRVSRQPSAIRKPASADLADEKSPDPSLVDSSAAED